MSVALLVALQRSGTGALGTIFNQHPETSYLGEVFLEAERGRPGNFNSFLVELVRSDPELALPMRAPQTFSRYLAHLDTVSPRPVKVIDVKYNSMHHFSAMAYDHHALALARSAGLPVVHLTRRNHLKVVVSLALAELNDVWHARQEGALRRRTLRLDPAATLAELRTYAAQAAAIAGYLAGYERVETFDYEEMLDAAGELAPAVEARLRSLLAIGPWPQRRPLLVKQAPDDLRAVIENFDEVAARLHDTAYAWMLGT